MTLINEEAGIRELSDARGSGPRQGGGPGGGAPWLNTLEYQSTVNMQMTFKELPNHLGLKPTWGKALPPPLESKVSNARVQSARVQSDTNV